MVEKDNGRHYTHFAWNEFKHRTKATKMLWIVNKLGGRPSRTGEKKISKDIKTQQMACYMHLHQLPFIWPNQHAFRCNSSIILRNYIRVTSTNNQCTQCVSFHLAARQVVGHPTTPRDLVSFSLGPNIDNLPNNRKIALY